MVAGLLFPALSARSHERERSRIQRVPMVLELPQLPCGYALTGLSTRPLPLGCASH